MLARRRGARYNYASRRGHLTAPRGALVIGVALEHAGELRAAAAALDRGEEPREHLVPEGEVGHRMRRRLVAAAGDHVVARLEVEHVVRRVPWVHGPGRVSAIRRGVGGSGAVNSCA